MQCQVAIRGGSTVDQPAAPPPLLGRTCTPSRHEFILIFLVFFLLAGANGIHISFNSAIPCGLIALALLSLRLCKWDSFVSLRWGLHELLVASILTLWCLGALLSTVVHLSHYTLLNLYAGYLAPFLIFASLLSHSFSSEQKVLILTAVGLGALIPFGWGLFAYLSSFGIPSLVEIFWNRYDFQQMAQYRRVAFGNTSHMGQYVSVVLPPLLVISASRHVPGILRSICVTAALLGIANLLLVFSRGAILTLLFLLLFWTIAFRSWRLLLSTILAAGLATWAMQSLGEAWELAVERTVGIFADSDGVDDSVAGRIDSIAVGWRLFADHPFFGVGPGLTYRLNEMSIAHQIVVEEGASIGIAGFAATAALTILVLVQSLRLAVSRTPKSRVNMAIWSGVLGWVIYTSVAGGLLNLGLLIPWAGLLYGFLGLTSHLPDSRCRD